MTHSTTSFAKHDGNGLKLTDFPFLFCFFCFCIWQVDLSTSSIRPGHSYSWLKIFKDELLSAVSLSSARIIVHSGTWSHDVNQAKLLPSDKVTKTAPFPFFFFAFLFFISLGAQLRAMPTHTSTLK